MKPRASAPRIRSGLCCLRPRAELGDRLRQRVGVGEQRRHVLEPDARLRPVRDLPDLLLQLHARSLRDQAAETAPEQALRQLLRELAERLQVARALLPPLGVPRAERGRDRRLEQARLAVDGRAERAQVAGRDAEAGEPAADRRDLGIALAVQTARRLRRAARAARTPRARARACGRSPRARRASPGRARPRRPAARARACGAARATSASRAPPGSPSAAGTRPAGAGGSSPAARAPPRRRAGSRRGSAPA